MKTIYEFLYKGHAKKVNNQINIDLDDFENYMEAKQDYTFKTSNNVKITVSCTYHIRNSWLNLTSNNIKQGILYILYNYANEINKDNIYTTSIDFHIELNQLNNYVLTFNIYKNLHDTEGYCRTKYVFPIDSDNIPDKFTIIKSITEKHKNQTIDDLVNYIKTANL